MTEAEQERLEYQHMLEELTTSEGWKRIVIPVLRARQAELERRLATSTQTLQEMATLQGAWKVLSDILSTPLQFFGPRRE